MESKEHLNNFVVNQVEAPELSSFCNDHSQVQPVSFHLSYRRYMPEDLLQLPLSISLIVY